MIQIPYSEIFASPQGEGPYAGRPSLWLRMWGCNLSCSGFFQPDPTDPSTYIKPWEKIDLSRITRLEDLPVLTHGCDSAYSHEKDFLKLAKRASAKAIAAEMFSLVDADAMRRYGSWMDITFTGGEPMINQEAINQVTEALFDLEVKDDHFGQFFDRVVIETNATKPVKGLNLNLLRNRLVMSISPKLFTVSGEKNAVKYDVIKSYFELSDYSYVKFVVANTKECWAELDRHLMELRFKGIHGADISIMPVGSTADQQGTADAAAIGDMCQRRGLHFSPRIQSFVYNNLSGK